jgi:hypothetical protein
MSRHRDIRLLISIFMAIAFLLLLPCIGTAGSLEPTPDAVDTSGNPASTMKTLNEIPPTWSKKLPCDSATHCPRFEIVMDGEAVLDKETGLVWERSPWNYQGDWWEAQWQCRASWTGNRWGWRLPTYDELVSLAEPVNDCWGYLPCGHPFINLNYCYWSTTDWPFDSNEAYEFCPTVGPSPTPKTITNRANWCVRGGFGVNLGVDRQ